jgi:hypothetical protein
VERVERGMGLVVVVRYLCAEMESLRGRGAVFIVTIF